MRSQFNIIHPSSGLKIDVIIPKKDEFDRRRFERRKNVQSPAVACYSEQWVTE